MQASQKMDKSESGRRVEMKTLNELGSRYGANRYASRVGIVVRLASRPRAPAHGVRGGRAGVRARSSERTIGSPEKLVAV